MKLLSQLLFKVKIFLKLSLKLSIILILLVLIFANFYSYSSLTKFIYSIEWLLVYTPLVANGELVIPPFISLAFHHFHALKVLLSRTSSYIYNDGYPEFEGKYHWKRNELAYCQSSNELFKGQSSNPKLHCFIYRMLLTHVKTELLNIDPPIVKYHEFFSQKQVRDFLRETDRVHLSKGKIMVKDSRNMGIWQDSLVVNGSFMNPYSSVASKRSFDYLEANINAFNFKRAEQFHIKKYHPGGHYAPHLDFLIINPEQQYGNRIATFMFILQTADKGGGTVFPDAGLTFQPKPGDALLWLNMDPSYNVASSSFHGACPVLAGTKVGVTIWIRSVGQELRYPCPLKEGKPFDYKWMTLPTWKEQTFWSYLNCRERKGCVPVKSKLLWQV